MTKRLVAQPTRHGLKQASQQPGGQALAQSSKMFQNARLCSICDWWNIQRGRIFALSFYFFYSERDCVHSFIHSASQLWQIEYKTGQHWDRRLANGVYCKCHCLSSMSYYLTYNMYVAYYLQFATMCVLSSSYLSVRCQPQLYLLTNFVNFLTLAVILTTVL